MNAFKGSLSLIHDCTTTVTDFYLGPWEDMGNKDQIKEVLISLGFVDGNKATENVLYVTARQDRAYNFVNRGGKALILIGSDAANMREAFIGAANFDVKVGVFDCSSFTPQIFEQVVRRVVGNRMPEPLLERLHREDMEASAKELAAFRRGCMEWNEEHGVNLRPI